MSTSNNAIGIRMNFSNKIILVTQNLIQTTPEVRTQECQQGKRNHR